MSYHTIEELQLWLQGALRYVEENILKLPRWRATRLLLIISAYYILRPWILKLAGLASGLGSQKDETTSPAATEAPNASTEAIDVSQDIDSEGEESDRKVARRRQKPLQEILEGKDRPPAEAEPDSDKEIEEFLRKVVK